MSTELPDQITEQEVSEPEYYPVVESPEVLHLDNMPDLEKDKIFHFVYKSGEKDQHRFILQKNIGNLNYIFYLGQSYDQYGLLFKTKEYQYATVNLSKDDQKSLWTTVALFIASVRRAGYDLKEITVSPADTRYSSEEIEQCLEEILASPKNELTRDEINERYRPHEIFYLYEEIYGKDFEGRHYAGKGRAKSRSRLFGIMFKKYLPDWTMEKEPYSPDVVLKRKEKEK